MAVSLTKDRRHIGTNPVDYTEIIGHFHIGANMPGYLPESDVYCLDVLADAVEAFVDNLRQQQDGIAEMCESREIEQKQKGSECCRWCEQWYDIEDKIVAASDQSLHYATWVDFVAWQSSPDTLGNVANYQYMPPEGANINHWISVHRDDRAKCMLHLEQD